MIPALPFDHSALRVLDRESACNSLTRIGYRVVDEFPLVLKDGSTARSNALVHDLNPEVFVTSGPPGSLIHKWVMARGGKGAVHHWAFEVPDVEAAMKAMINNGYRFDREKPLVCSCERPLTQIFTEEDPHTGLIYELIARNGHPGFCKENVVRLMSGNRN